MSAWVKDADEENEEKNNHIFNNNVIIYYIYLVKSDTLNNIYFLT